MSFRTSLHTGFITLALAVAAAGVSPVLAGPGGDGPPPGGETEPTPAQRITRRALAAIGHTAREACQDLRRGTLLTVGNIARADRRGATDAQVTGLGTSAVTRLTARAAAAVERINAAGARALAALTENGGTAEQAARIATAADAAIERISDRRDDAAGRVNAAVTRATGGG